MKTHNKGPHTSILSRPIGVMREVIFTTTLPFLVQRFDVNFVIYERKAAGPAKRQSTIAQNCCENRSISCNAVGRPQWTVRSLSLNIFDGDLEVRDRASKRPTHLNHALEEPTTRYQYLM